MAVAPPTFQVVSYTDPWGPPPPGTFQAGLLVQASGSAPGGYVLAAQLLQGGSPFGPTVVGSPGTSVRVLPPSPLDGAAPYTVMAQWVTQGTSPNQVDWTNTASIATAPVIAVALELTGGLVVGGNAVMSWGNSGGVSTPSGGVVTLFDQTGLAASQMSGSGNSATSAFAPTAGSTYTAYVQGLEPINAQGQGGFAGPYSIGPVSGPWPVPAFGPAVTSVSYDGAALAVAWTPAPAPTSPPMTDVEYVLALISNGQVVATFPAGSAGGRAVVDLPAVGTALQVAGFARFGPVTGPLGAAQAILSIVPRVSQVVLSPSPTAGNVRATVTLQASPGWPSGAQLSAQLMVNGALYATQLANGPPFVATFDVPSWPGGSFVQAQGVMMTAGVAVALTGPTGPPVTVVTGTPGTPAAGYDGARLSVAWAPVADPTVTGYLVTVSGVAPNTFVTGPEPFLSVPAALAFGTPYQVTVQALGPSCVGLPSPTLVYTLPNLPAVTVVSTQVVGGVATITWEPVAAPWIDGYLVTVTGTPGGGGSATTLTFPVGPVTSLAVTLPTAAPCLWTATVAATAGGNVGPATNPALLLTAVPVLTALTVSGGTVNAAWSLGGATSALLTQLAQDGAQVEVQILDGASVVAAGTSAVTGGGSGSTAVTLPTVASTRLAAVAQLTGPGQFGPTGGAVAVLPSAPAVGMAAYDGERLALAWQGGATAGVLGYNVTLSPVSGNPFTLTTGPETVLDVPLYLDLSTTWQASVQPFGANTTGPASPAVPVSLPAVSPPTVRAVVYDGVALTVTWDRATLPGLTGYVVSIGGMSYQAGPVTSLTLPLSPASAAGAAVTVAGVSPGRNTAASGPVSVIAAAPVITSVSVGGGSVTVAWSPPNVPGGTSFVAEVLDGDTVMTSQSGTPTGVSLPMPSGGSGSYAVRGRAESVQAFGPAGAAVAILPTPPSALFGAILDGALTLQWAPPGTSGVSGYAVSVNGTTAGTSDTRINLPLPASSLTAGSVSVAAVGPNTQSPTASLTIASALAVQSGTYDGGTLSVVLSGGNGGAPSLVWVDVLVDGAVAARGVVSGVPTTAVAVPVALPPGAAASVRVTGVGGVTLTLPSAPVTLPTAAPSAVSAVYDGTQLHVAWQPVATAGVTGYLVSVFGASSTIPPVYVAGAGASGTAIAAGFTLPFGSGAGVTVQAATMLTSPNVLAGPAAPAAAPSLAGYLRAVAVPAASQPPYLYRLGRYQTLAVVSASNVVAYLPNPFTGQNTPTVPPGSGQMFQLSPAPSGSALPYQLTIDQSVWTTFGADAVRVDLRTAYRSFLIAVEQAGVAPWAIRQVRQIIAEAMPQTFAETLYYRYGVWRDNALRAVDLEPGLRLQVAGALYQLVTGGAPDPRNGFTPSGAESYDLAEVIPSGFAVSTPDGPARALSVDAFLSLLMPGAGGAVSDVAAGPVDFFQASNRQTYYRLFYPPSFLPSGNTGVAQITDNVAVIGAPSWQALEAATDQYAQTGFFPPSGNYFSAYFRGRATLTPLLALWVGGEPRWVPVGTTLRQVLATVGLAVWPGPGGVNAVGLARPVAGLFDQPFGGTSLRYEPVDLSDAAVAASTPPLWPLDLPVLGGDAVTLGPGPSPGA